VNGREAAGLNQQRNRLKALNMSVQDQDTSFSVPVSGARNGSFENFEKQIRELELK